MKKVKLVVLKNFEFENQPSKLLISFWLSAVSASQDSDVMKNIDYFSLKNASSSEKRLVDPNLMKTLNTKFWRKQKLNIGQKERTYWVLWKQGFAQQSVPAKHICEVNVFLERNFCRIYLKNLMLFYWFFGSLICWLVKTEFWVAWETLWAQFFYQKSLHAASISHSPERKVYSHRECLFYRKRHYDWE